MYYKLYIDSLFFTDFIMNFYLLSLVNCMRGRSATRLRRIAGAAYGAGIYCMTFFLPLPGVVLKVVAGMLLSGAGMAVITFRTKNLLQIGKASLAMLGAAFYLGGVYLFLKNQIPFFKGNGGPLQGALLGGVAYAVGCFVLKKNRREKKPGCQVTLQGIDENLTVEALIDTGNSLTEPISKRPVSILDEKTLQTLYKGSLPAYYRVVPYTSIGKKKGLLKCFEIPKIWVNDQESEKVYEKVLIACSEEFTPKEGFLMLLNPRLIKNQEEHNYDI